MEKLYMSRKEAGKGFASIEDWIDTTIQGLKEYTKKSKERLNAAASNKNTNIRRNSETTKPTKQRW